MKRLSHLPDDPGIYKVTCAASGEIYVGSAANLRKRWNHHLCHLRKGAHPNQKLQRAWDKYGEASFSCSVLEVCGRDALIPREQYHIDTLAPFYNLRPIAGRTALGTKQSPDHIKKRVEARRRNGTYTRTPEWTEALRQAMIKRGMPEEVRKKGNEYFRTHGHTPEARAKMSASAKARGVKPPGLKDPRNPSPETRAKMRAARLRYLERQKQDAGPDAL
jgi:group I intron endonuclease